MIEKKCSLKELDKLTEELIEFAKDCKIILLRGDLASGKTTLVQKFSKALGLDAEITSPTFSIQNSHDGKLYHYDIYQNGIDAFLSLGLFEELDRDGFHLIEWGDEELEKVLKSYFIDYITVDIRKNSQNDRVYRVKKCIN